MEIQRVEEKQSFIEIILDNKAIIFIFAGIAIRIFMLIFYYYTHMQDPQRSWGDVGINFQPEIYYPPVSTYLLILFTILSFESIEIFAFWAFFWDLLTSLMFYFVLKNFQISNKKYVFGLFLINPLLFLNNVFSLDNCGYHITDSFFFFFFFMALIFYSRKELYSKYLFYIFIGLSICAKYYTFPALGFFFIKFIYQKNWKEMKIFAICMISTLIIFLITPIFFLPGYLESLIYWTDERGIFPLYIRLLPIGTIFLLYTLLRLRKGDSFEILIISILAMSSFIFLSDPYLRLFQSIIFYGILKSKYFFTFNLNLGFIKREIKVDNHLLTFYLSFLGVLFSILWIIFFLQPTNY